MDDAERTINDCVNTVKCTIKDKRFLPGAGAIEIVNLTYIKLCKIYTKIFYRCWLLKLQLMLKQLQD